MRFTETSLPGAWVIELDLLEDERGWFARTFDAEDFSSRGMDGVVEQCNASFTARCGTVRGMHYQAEPHGESKLVRCVRGAIFDVALDLRPDAPSFRKWHAVELSAENRRAFYMPAGIAHGFQTLVDDCEVLYQMGHPYVAEAVRGVRWDDPAFAIQWPAPPSGEHVLFERDRLFPDFRPEGA